MGVSVRRVTALLVTTLLCLTGALAALPPTATATTKSPATAMAMATKGAGARTGAPASTVRAVPRSLPVAGDDTVAPMSYPGLPDVAARAVAVPGRVRILVMRVFWADSPPKFPDTGQTRALMKDTARWFARTSRGRHHVTSKVTPWLRVGGAGANCFDLRGSTRRAIAAARARGTGPGGFNRYMLVMPQCGTNSQGEMPGRVTWIRERKPHLDVLTHELGHNLGLDHANSLICQADKRRITQGGKCTTQEYGDLWDAMGLSSRPYSVPVLQRLGWAGRVAATTKSGTWTLRDAEASGKGVQALRIRVSRSVSYWLEYHTTGVSNERQPGSFAISGTPGLQVRLDTGQKSLRILDAAPGNPDDSLLFPDADLVNPTLPVGSSFTTPQRVRVTLLSQDAGSAKVQVSFGKRAGVPDPPTLLSAVADVGSYSDQARLTIKPGAGDGGQVVLGYVVTWWPSGKTTFLADPGGRRSTLTVSYSGATPAQWSVRAVNQVGSSPDSARVEHHVPAPRLTILSPTPGASVPGPTVHVAVDAQPDALSGSPVSSVTVCLDEVDCETDSAAPWSVDLTTGDAPHLITVTARDEDGGEGTASTSVTVVPAPPTVRIDSPADGATVAAGDVTVTVTPTPNAATGRPVEAVAIRVYRTGSPYTWDAAYLDAAPWSSTFTLTGSDTPVTYRIEVTASDATYESAPAVVNLTVSPSP
jgi:hypothetical protein